MFIFTRKSTTNKTKILLLCQDHTPRWNKVQKKNWMSVNFMKSRDLEQTKIRRSSASQGIPLDRNPLSTRLLQVKVSGNLRSKMQDNQKQFTKKMINWKTVKSRTVLSHISSLARMQSIDEQSSERKK